jgi:pSer/pThr/pTyr-binding forkhead associated (FHA) protein
VGKGWTVTDLGSTNGVHCDGRRLQPHQPEPLRPRSFLVIGNIEFFVEIRTQNDQDQTERIGNT